MTQICTFILIQPSCRQHDPSKNQVDPGAAVKDHWKNIGCVCMANTIPRNKWQLCSLLNSAHF